MTPRAPASVPRRRGGCSAEKDLQRGTSDRGFTLVEVMVAVVIFVIVSTATVAVLVQALRVIRDNADRVMAANIARSQVEYLRTLGTTAIPIGLMSGAVPPGQSANRVDPRVLDPKFTIRTTSNWVGFSQTQNACAAAVPGQAYMRVTVEVSSPNLSRPVSVDTVIFPETTYQVTGSGSATVALVDQVGAPVSDVLVRGVDAIHPTNNFTLTSGTDGCLFIPNLVATGSLSVTASRAGYVSQTPTGTQAVLQITSGNVSRSSFKLAAAATLQFESEDATFTIPAGIPVTWQFNTTGASANAAVMGTPATGLWPEPNGIAAYAGSCSDADPLAYSVARTSYALDAGGTAIAPLQSAPVRVRGLEADMPVTVRYVGTDAACAFTPLVVGRSNNQGVLRIGLPYGDWEFVAGGQTQRVPAPLRPLSDGSTPEPVLVEFTLADLDNPCPSPSPSGSPTPSGTPTPTPTPTGTVCPSPSGSP